TSCQTEFEVGKRYLITSYGNSIAAQHTDGISIIGGLTRGGKRRPSGAVVVVGVCSGSKPIDYASEDLAFVRQNQRRPQNATIMGSVRAGDNFFGWHDDHPPIADVEIGVIGSGRTIHTKTDSQGKFTVPDVQPGAYTVTARKAAYRATKTGYQVRVPEHGCGVAQIELITNARVSGQVLRHDGSPAPEVPVEVMYADAKHRPAYFRLNSARTDKQGRFRIADLPAGHFLVGAYIGSGPTMDARIPPTFWRNTTVQEKAEVLNLLPDQEMRDVNIRLPAPVGTRKVAVHVRWPDGRPAKAAYVNVSPHVPGEFNNASDGTFTVLEAVEYKFNGRLWTNFRDINGNKIPADFVDGEAVLSAGKGPSEITLIMNKPCCRKR
ncbi:MAG TPA: carboxypeptidase regulatory-like domain-containing protein, partial [Terriglobales bacterium]|nr:carboxypeptidase regulatory-like domain-containing protein [Terriglobales bacterium]